MSSPNDYPDNTVVFYQEQSVNSELGKYVGTEGAKFKIWESNGRAISVQYENTDIDILNVIKGLCPFMIDTDIRITMGTYKNRRVFIVINMKPLYFFEGYNYVNKKIGFNVYQATPNGNMEIVQVISNLEGLGRAIKYIDYFVKLALDIQKRHYRNTIKYVGKRLREDGLIEEEKESSRS